MSTHCLNEKTKHTPSGKAQASDYTPVEVDKHVLV